MYPDLKLLARGCAAPRGPRALNPDTPEHEGYKYFVSAQLSLYYHVILFVRLKLSSFLKGALMKWS